MQTRQSKERFDFLENVEVEGSVLLSDDSNESDSQSDMTSTNDIV
jgi:hypothetical protein